LGANALLGSCALKYSVQEVTEATDRHSQAPSTAQAKEKKAPMQPAGTRKKKAAPGNGESTGAMQITNARVHSAMQKR